MQLLAVNYHYIRQLKPSRGIYPRSIDEMAFQLEELGRHYDFISQEELIKIVKSKIRPKGNYCIVTFDDNLKEQIKAYEYLERNYIPALFFATTLPYQGGIHDVHKLHHIYTSYNDLEIAEVLERQFSFYDFEYDYDVLKQEYRYDTQLKRQIKFFLNFILSKQERQHVVNRLFIEIVDSDEDFISNLYMSKNELTHLAYKGMLGTHTHSHLPLATLSEKKIKDEISLSIKLLSGLTGKSIHSISYPFGGFAAVNNKVADIASSLGLDVGFTMNRGINSNDDVNNSLLLKRVDTNDAPGGKLKSLVYCP